jgi:hypothetical protein
MHCHSCLRKAGRQLTRKDGEAEHESPIAAKTSAHQKKKESLPISFNASK